MDLRTYRSTRLTVSVMVTAMLAACSASSDRGAQGTPAQSPALVDIVGDNAGNSDSNSSSNQTDSPGFAAANEQQSSDETAALVADASNVPCESSLNDFRETMLAMVNTSRQSDQHCGSRFAPATTTVRWSDQLMLAAENHADDMVTVNFFDHTGSDGLGVADRVEATGYDWRAVGENIAAGQRNIAEVHQGWLDSPGHCRNIMNSLYTEIGAACIADDTTDFGTYWVVVFGDPR